jgi:hypothetical protein
MNDRLERLPLLGRSEPLIAVGHGLYRAPEEPVATHAISYDAAGKPLLLTADYYGVGVPAWTIWLRIVGACCIAVVVALWILIAPVWAGAMTWKGHGRAAFAFVPSWLAALASGAFVVLVFTVDSDHFGEPTAANVIFNFVRFGAPGMALLASMAALFPLGGAASRIANSLATASVLVVNIYLIAYGAFGLQLY